LCAPRLLYQVSGSILLLVLATSASGAASAQAPAADTVPGLPATGPATSLLVVSPHPDDESLCCAGAIQRVLHAGGRVSIVWITSGDASELDLLVVEKSLFIKPEKLRDLAGKRMEEARAAAAILGVPPDRLFFLGYPDRGVLRIITDNYVTPYRSKFTAASAVPYAAAMFPGHPYTGQSLERDFEAVLDRVHPTLVLAPSPRDSHPDHRATGILTLRALARRGEVPKARYWIVHGGKLWPFPRGYDPDRKLSAPPRGQGLPWKSLPLGSAEVRRKQTAISAYHTQMEIMSSFLLSFARSNELYSAVPMPEGVDTAD
jgi:LmbE family N-acetylglucosaminyl deacetylase